MRLSSLALLFSFLLIGATSAAQVLPQPGEWPCPRRNGTLDGHSPARGNITAPKIGWTLPIGSRECLFVAVPNGTEDSAGSPEEAADARWGLAPHMGELEWKQQPIPTDAFHAYADVLPDAPGLEKFEVRREGTTLCFAWRNNAWERIWETERMDYGNTVTANPIVGDFDADGAPELAILPWYNLVVIDAVSGRIEDICRFTEGRSYGYFGVHDLDSDGKQEFVVQADFAKHVDVLGYRDGKLAMLWQEPIELDISNPQKILRVHPRCVADIDGDGRQEVLINRYDGAWRIEVRDGLSGVAKTELRDTFFAGVCDVNADHAEELLTTRTAGGGVPAFGPISVYTWRDGGLTALWDRADAGWQTWEPPLPANINSGATYGRRTALVRETGLGVTAVLREKGGNALRLAVWTANGFESRVSVQAPSIEAMAVDAAGQMLCRSVLPPEQSLNVQLAGASLRRLGERNPGVAPAPPAVACAKGEEPFLVVQGTGESLAVLHPPREGKPAEVLRRINGRGQSTTWPQAIGPVIADLHGDGGRQIVYAAAAPGGYARLVAEEWDGREVWHHDFEAIPGTPPVWNSGGIVLWQTAHFTSSETQDVLITIRRSMMHSEETALLSGADGRELWRRMRQNTEMHSRGVGGTPFALADFDGDGLDDIASFYPSLFYLLQGNTGKNLHVQNAVWDPVPEKPVYYGLPVAGDFEGNGKASVMMAGAPMTALIRADGTLAWWDALSKSPTAFAFGDFDGDKKPEVLGFGYEDGIRGYDAATGLVKWRMPLPWTGTPAGTASGDINTDGRDEALVTAGNVLYGFGIGEDGSPGLLWQVALSATAGPPVIVQCAQPGRGAEILVLGADGVLYSAS